MRYELKRWKERYTEMIAVYADNPDVAKWMDDDFPSPFTPEAAAGFIQERLAADEEREYSRAVIIDGAVAGGILLRAGKGSQRVRASISFWLGEPFRKQGIMSEAVRLVCRDAMNTLGIESVFAETYADNLPARSVLNEVGFSLECVLHRSRLREGELQDVCLYQLTRDE